MVTTRPRLDLYLLPVIPNPGSLSNHWIFCFFKGIYIDLVLNHHWRSLLVVGINHKLKTENIGRLFTSTVSTYCNIDPLVPTSSSQTLFRWSSSIQDWNFCLRYVRIKTQAINNMYYLLNNLIESSQRLINQLIAFDRRMKLEKLQ